jgi:glycosyltransferase involved in cell wall biosynthesis
MIVCLSKSWGGLEQVAVQDATDLHELGIAVEFLCLAESPIEDQLKSKGIRTYPIDFYPRNNFDFKLRKIILSSIKRGINLIHSHQTTLLGSISPWLYRHPEVSLFATRHIWCSHDKRDLFHRIIYQRLDSLIVMSHSLRRNVMQTHPLRERQVKLINLGLDFTAFDPVRISGEAKRKAWGIPERALVIGMVGRIDPAKGQDLFIKAAAGLMKYPTEERPIHFVIVGEETRGEEQSYLPELKEMVRQFRLEPHVHFVGFDSDIPEVMSAFDIFVMPSRDETFGLVAIEAMAMERPVIISKGGSADEIVGADHEFGFQVRPDDAFDLQVHLRKLIDDPSLRLEMGKLGRQHVLSLYDRTERLRKTLVCYERAYRRRGLT